MLRRLKIAGSHTLMLVSGLLLATSSSYAQTRLRWKFTPGQQFDQVFEQAMKMSMKLADQPIDTSVRQTIDAVWDVKQVDDQGVAEVVQQFRRIRMKMDSAAGISFEIDTDSDEDPTGLGSQLGPSIRAMAKSKFTVKVTPEGKYREVEISQDTLDAFKALPKTGQMSRMFSEKSLINMVKQGSYSFPAEPVRRGESWTNKAEMDVPQLGKMSSEVKLTYAGPEQIDGKSLERIDIDVAMKIDPQKDGGGLVKVTVKDHKASGTLYFDNAAGRLSHSELVQKTVMEMAIGDNNISQDIEQTVKVHLTSAEN
jgi:hypothetical protein